MNINIGNPFFLHNQIILHNSRLSIDSKLLSKLIGVTYPTLLKTIQVILNQNAKRKNDFILVASTYHAGQKSSNQPEYLITPHGVDILSNGQLKHFFDRHKQRSIQRHLKFRSYDQRIQD